MWRRIRLVLVGGICLFGGSLADTARAAGVVVGPVAEQIMDDQTYTGQEQALTHDQQENTVTEQAVRGGYRSSPGTYRGGAGVGTGTSAGGYRTGPRAPSGNVTNRTPAGTGAGPSTGRFGSFFGGLAAGAFLGHLFNPFGYWGGGYGGGGFTSLFSLLLWAALIYLTYRVIKWLFRGRIR